MKPERWRQVDQLFQEALERAPEDRAAFVDAACGKDDSLRREVEALLVADAEEGTLIDAPAYAAAAMLIEREEASSFVGKSIGQYQIVSLLGKGGVGEVYRARDSRLCRDVALKVLSQNLWRDAAQLRRFEREARAASALNHPNIITVYEIGEAQTDAGTAQYIVTEYVEGETLRQRMSAGRVELDEALGVATQVANALASAHAAGIMHRDIKPENVMLRPDGLVKVLDFGLAKLSERPTAAPTFDTKADTVDPLSTERGIVMGTVSYMSPEQARGLKADHRTDIFSLGVTLYEMIAGRRPFEGATMIDKLAALLTAEPAPLRQRRAEVSEATERVVSRCLAKDREARYQSAEELIAELKAIPHDGRGKGLTAARALRRSIPGLSSWRWFAAGLAVIALALAATALYFSFSRRAQAPQPDQIKSLAVLPLVNLSGDPAQDYFADGVTESLIASLARVGALRVISRTSMTRYKGTRKALPEIARELDVDAVLEGSAERFGDRMKISARLMYAPTERQLWAETYERGIREALATQDEIARAVVQQIQIGLTPQEKRRLAGANPVSPAAYDDYLRGRFYFNRENKADNETAIQMLERAVNEDPNFAAAYAELAQAYVYRSFLFTPEDRQLEEKAYVAVGKALSLDPNSASAYLARGRLLWTPSNHFPHETAIREFRHALALNPNSDETQTWIALVYNHIGAFDQALRELRKAVAINPTNISAQFRIGQTLLFQGKYEQALTALRNIPKEGNPRVGYHRAMALLHLGRRDEAAAIARDFLAEYPKDADGGLLTGFHALLAASAGDERKAEDRVRSAVEKGKGFGHFHHTVYDIACAYSLMNKAEPAVKWLKAAADDGFPCYPLFERDPFLDPVRNDPRFTALMASLKDQWARYRTEFEFDTK
jgi:serine/threonine-protein kinase